MATPPTRVSYNTPTVGFGSTTTPKTTPAFDVQAGDLLVFIGSGEDSPATIGTPSASGGSVTWTSQQSIVVSNYCTMYLWTGAVGATATGITVSASGVSSREWSFGVTVWRNHGGVGVTGKTNVSSGAPSLALATSANSAVQCGSDDWNAADGTTRTWRTVNGSAMTESLYFRDSTRYTVYAGYAPDTGAAGTTTVGLSAPSAQKYSIVGVEILGTGGSTGATVNAVVATVSDAAVAPTVSGGATVTGVAATVSVAAIAPTVSTATNGTVNAVVATASLAGVAPVVTGGSSLTAVAATASTAAVAPTVAGGATVTGVKATDSVAAVAPVVSGGASLTAVVATASLAAIAPVVSASSPGAVNAVVATSSLAAVAPVVSGGASVTAVKATLSTAATAPVVAVNATVSAVAATVAAQALPPVVGSPDAQIVAVVANLSMAAYAPRVSSAALSYTLITPVKILNYGEAGPLGHRINYPTGSSILKIGGFYQTLDYPSDEAIEASEVAYLGGHTYTISQSERDALVAAGYGAYITEVIP